MKYPSALVGFIAFAIAMVWSWNLIHEEPPIPIETHSGIQERLSQLIIDTIHTKKPTASDVQIERVWTEAVNAHQVKAFFVYSYHESAGENAVANSTRIQGQGILDELDDDGSGQSRWKLSQVKMTHDSVSFDEALVITAGPDSHGENAPATETK